MKHRCPFALTVCFVTLTAFCEIASSQSLRSKIEGIFDDVLNLQLAGSPGEHGEHFSPSNVASSAKVMDALTNFIGTNLSSIPLSSTVAGVTFDLSSGVPVRSTTGLGPIFSENASSLGRGRIILGYNFTYMNLNKIRGLGLRDLRFTFTHQDVDSAGLGDSDNELDTIDLFMNMDLSATILAFYFTVGVTSRLDVGVAVPIVNIRLEAEPLATMNSFTLLANDSAEHFYGGSRTDPVLTTRPRSLNDDATGIGDIALRAKYNFRRSDAADLAALIEVRLPTGEEDNFLGSGATSIKSMLIISSRLGDFSPHLNLAYNFRTKDLANDEIQLFLGYDQKLGEPITLAVDLLGEFEVGDQKEKLRFDDVATIRRPAGDTVLVRDVELTNLPQFGHDHILNASVGVKIAPRDFLGIVANVIVPLNDGGLRPDLVSTVGFEFNF